MDFHALKVLLDREGVDFLDLKTVDLFGNLRHLSLPSSSISSKVLTEGIGFDASSYGLSSVESSDLVLIPDLSTCFKDPFREQSVLSCFATMHLPDRERTPFPLDCRLVAKKAEALLFKKVKDAVSFWGPEYEFYLFQGFQLFRDELSLKLEITPLENIKEGYHADLPQERSAQFRDQASKVLEKLKISVKYHHHEGGGIGQQEIETLFESLLKTCDDAILIRYALKNLARDFGLFLTFMPKPIQGVPGNGWHLHCFLKVKEENIFYSETSPYSNFSKIGLYFMGGVLKHSRSLCAFSNPSTNSYKRLVPGFEAPTSITFGKGNRNSACRIPGYVADPQETRFEYRPPDSTCNPYLCLSSILLAGLDGIEEEIDPQSEGLGPFDGDSPPGFQEGKIKFLPRSLDEALDSLEEDYEFLTRDGVFPELLLERWIKMKREEAKEILFSVHPSELEKYF
ncbi:MAG: glutamine synthetase beta-grasp domain-containing protein [Caldiserica bacterium]|jgi:glutamine synthetase|nr:glutamine synthetase beta-grasp domain-containing protein [Caldisericota bacterium]MDH7561785.1 glutamine synthetase beta-grasp domain-containing protein [Caldisericota bacterium]